MANEYDASNITVLKGLEAVRVRPAMYIGGTDIEGLHHLIWEIVDNSIDEALAGYAKNITVILNQDNSVTIKDDGRGIPTGIHPVEKVSALQLTATVLHAGGKFDNSTYKVSSGLHGVGLSVVNALSSDCKIEVHQKGKIFVQEYKEGVPLYEVKENGITDITGTTVTFKPDSKIFSETLFISSKIKDRLRQHAYLNGGIKFIFEDKREESSEKYGFYFEGGVGSYIKHLNINQRVIHSNIFYLKKNIEKESISLEVAFQYTDDIQVREYAFANNIHNKEGGTHITALRTALTRGINLFISENLSEKEKSLSLTSDDVREGITCAISVKISNPQFEGQTKIKLNNAEIVTPIKQIIEENLKNFLLENPKDTKNIVDRIILANKARTAAKAARDAIIRKGAFEGGGLPGKLADCASKKAEECELFIVEGDSAAGPAKQARNRHNQAILPVFGKTLNTEKSRLDKIISSEKLADIIKALGSGIGETFDIKKLRYHKIILMSDADVDGAHIRTLNLTLFFRHFKEIVTNGYLYIAQPPLYKVTYGANEVHWVSDDRELQILLNSKKKNKEPLIQRFKGLGEMNHDQLWETTMNPETRSLKKIDIESFEEADNLFDILMGEEVAPRKKYIQTYSKDADLDI